jgi:hypothetical protein
MSVEELQSAVAQLPAEELDRFARWFEEFLAESIVDPKRWTTQATCIC